MVLARQVGESLKIRRRARSLSCSSEIIVEVFIRFNGRHEVIVSKRYVLSGRESVGHTDCVLDLHSTISKEPLEGVRR